MGQYSGAKSIGFIAALMVGVGAAATSAAPVPSPGDQHPPSASDFVRIQGEMARLQQDVREQKQLILQLMQMHDALLKYLQLGGGAPEPGAGAPPTLLAPTASAPAVNAGPRTATAAASPTAAGTRALISGTVRSNAGPLTDLYVYLDGPKTLGSRLAPVEIKQQGRQFVPAVAVVQVGTRVLFPNEDKVFHNVFSRTPGDAFDLGTLKSGDRPGPVVLLKPGHVEVFCNIHSRMRADILVVPNGYWARVRPDGTFQLPGVPVGGHRLVLWGPGIKPATQRVEVSSAGANIALSAEGVTRKPHLNKQGGAYESYEE